MAACLMVPADCGTQDRRYALLRPALEFQLHYEETIASQALSASVHKDQSGVQIPWETTANRDLIDEELKHAVFCQFSEAHGLDSEL